MGRFDKSARRPEPRPPPELDPNQRLVLGLQPVREAIRVHKSAITRVLLESRESERLEALARFASDQGIARVERVERSLLDHASRGVSHQGALAIAPPLAIRGIEALSRERLLAIALDSIQDPQNFGAVIRSAVALASAPIVWGEHSSAPLTPATFRASAGAIEHACLVRVRSFHHALLELRDQDVQVVGLDAQAQTNLRDLDLQRSTVLVIGSEHTGLARSTRRACTTLARLVQPGPIDSLNASAAAAIALYAVAVQRVNSDT